MNDDNFRAQFISAIEQVSAPLAAEVARIVECLQQHEADLPTVRWMIDPLWITAGWVSTGYQWHPTSDAPPVLGLHMQNPEHGRELFKSWLDRCGREDDMEEIRVAFIEGDIPGQDPGYSLHIGPDPLNSVIRATANGVDLSDIPIEKLGHVRRMHPVNGVAEALERFKEEYDRHQEFLLAPVSRRDDGQLWVDVEYGIIKTTAHFRQVDEITDDDIDAVVLQTPIVV